MKFNQIEYANTEVKLATEILQKNPNDQMQIDRIVYWSAYLKDFKTAEKWANTEKTRSIIDNFKNG